MCEFVCRLDWISRNRLESVKLDVLQEMFYKRCKRCVHTKYILSECYVPV